MPSDLTPHRNLTPAACRELVKALDQAVDTFTAWNIRIPPQAPLHGARAWLETLGNQSEAYLTAAEFEQTSTYHALVVDLSHIALSMPDEPNAFVASELAHVVRASPTKPGPAQDYLSQFWVGSLLAQSGLHPHIDARLGAVAGSRPDFTAEARTLKFMVEVKCPKNRNACRRALSSAATQLHSQGPPGVIFVDATHALGLNPFSVTGDGPTARTRFQQANSELHAELVKHAVEYRHSDKFSRVAVVVTFARFWSWILRDAPVRDAGFVMTSDIFPNACQGLIAPQADAFQTALLKGIQQLTGNAPSAARR